MARGEGGAAGRQPRLQCAERQTNAGARMQSRDAAMLGGGDVNGRVRQQTTSTSALCSAMSALCRCRAQSEEEKDGLGDRSAATGVSTSVSVAVTVSVTISHSRTCARWWRGREERRRARLAHGDSCRSPAAVGSARCSMVDVVVLTG